MAHVYIYIAEMARRRQSLACTSGSNLQSEPKQHVGSCFSPFRNHQHALARILACDVTAVKRLHIPLGLKFTLSRQFANVSLPQASQSALETM